MAKVTELNDGLGHPDYMFYCPGCKIHHAYWTKSPSSNGAKWTFNGDLDKPTFRASLLNTWPQDGKNNVCHLFVTDGKIEYCADSTHELAGKTIEMEEV